MIRKSRWELSFWPDIALKILKGSEHVWLSDLSGIGFSDPDTLVSWYILIMIIMVSHQSWYPILWFFMLFSPFRSTMRTMSLLGSTDCCLASGPDLIPQYPGGFRGLAQKLEDTMIYGIIWHRPQYGTYEATMAATWVWKFQKAPGANQHRFHHPPCWAAGGFRLKGLKSTSHDGRKHGKTFSRYPYGSISGDASKAIVTYRMTIVCDTWDAKWWTSVYWCLLVFTT